MPTIAKREKGGFCVNIALCHYRIGETDGVSLEMEKWKRVLEKMGHTVYFIAGNKGNQDTIVIDELNYQHPEDEKLIKNGYRELNDYKDAKEYREAVLQFSKKIKDQLNKIIDKYDINVLIPNNIWSLGRSISAALAFAEVAEERNIKCLAHHHDFYWEREAYSQPTNQYVNDWLNTLYPPKLPNIEHVVINKIAQEEIKARKGVTATVVPNILDFDMNTWEIDDYNQDFRSSIGIKDNDIFILQATRIAERKAIEIAIDTVAKLNDKKAMLYGQTLYNGQRFDDQSDIILVLAGLVEAEEDYIQQLIDRAQAQHVTLKFINDRIEATRVTKNGEKNYSLWDAYVHADIITYPSILEGWGNQFLEGIYAKKPMVVYEYPVFLTDIQSLGFHYISLGSEFDRLNSGLVSIEDNIIDKAAERTIDYLLESDLRREHMDENYQIASEKLSYDALESIFKELKLNLV